MLTMVMYCSTKDYLLIFRKMVNKLLHVIKSQVIKCTSLEQTSELMQQVTIEDFITLSHYESFKTYTGYYSYNEQNTNGIYKIN